MNTEEYAQERILELEETISNLYNDKEELLRELESYEKKIEKLKRKNKKLKKEMEQVKEFYWKIFKMVALKNNGVIPIPNGLLTTPIIEENKKLFIKDK